MSRSETAEVMNNLKRLSELDEQLATLSEKKKTHQTRIRTLENDLQNLKDEIDAALRRVKEESHQEHKDEVLLKETEAELAKVGTQLNTAKTNEELRIFKKKRRELQDRISQLEDSILSHLAGLDSDRDKIQASRQGVKQREEESGREIAQLQESISRLEDEEAQVSARRGEIASHVPRDILRKYERVLAKEKRRPVVEVRNHICQGCYMKVTLQEINLIWRGDDLVLCRNCSRILCLPEEEMNESPA
jgi:predicted  nucleic acid-binding Zn-ribbon protein